MQAINDLADHELTGLLSVGSESAFVEIYNRYKTVLYLHARRMLDEDAAANDVIQETFISLWDKRKDIVFTTSLKSYLYSSVRNKVLNIIMRQKHADRYLVSMRDLYNSGSYATDNKILESDLAKLIEREIEKLPSRMREVFILSRKEHLSYREIAVKMSISEETVKKQIGYALKILRLKIGLIFIFGYVAKFFL